ncbi:2TM domain-containing protein [Tenacibaculum sp. 190130A14a]|uniref:2TM domain-containing protein n=1 Tax=Tenacibaculum polynesiense TaxID=3137857 RepID=A0ABP1EYK0_9FLAO
MENKFIEEKKYLAAKKRIKQIKGFYAHAFVNVISIIIIVTVNLVFSPWFHWFWFAVAGIVIVTFIHWMLVFGQNVFGFGEDWEEKKIKEYLNKKE